jgi:N-acetylglucosamine-6-phosphate deacetylase
MNRIFVDGFGGMDFSDSDLKKIEQAYSRNGGRAVLSTVLPYSVYLVTKTISGSFRLTPAF